MIAGRPSCVGLGWALRGGQWGPGDVGMGGSGCKVLMWEEGAGADLLSLVRETAPAMLVRRHGVAERAAGRRRPWRWP